MLMPGPSTTPTPRARASTAIARPTRPTRSASHELPSAAAVGKHVAGTQGSTKGTPCGFCSRRSPCGPSLSHTAGIPRAASGLVVHTLPPLVRRTFSSKVIDATSVAAQAP